MKSSTKEKKEPIDPATLSKKEKADLWQYAKLKRGKKGRPLEILPEEWMYARMSEIASEGGYVAQMLVEFDICRATFYRWVNEYPDFAEAYEKAKNHHQAFLEREGLKLMLTGKGNATMFAIFANNRFKEDYQRSASGGGGNDNQVNIGTINVLQTMPIEELKAMAQEKMKELGFVSSGETYDVEAEDQ
jgi:hypothetical protein